MALKAISARPTNVIAKLQFQENSKFTRYHTVCGFPSVADWRQQAPCESRVAWLLTLTLPPSRCKPPLIFKSKKNAQWQVREVFDLGETLLFVATARLSALMSFCLIRFRKARG